MVSLEFFKFLGGSPASVLRRGPAAGTVPAVGVANQPMIRRFPAVWVNHWHRETECEQLTRPGDALYVR